VNAFDRKIREDLNRATATIPAFATPRDALERRIGRRRAYRIAVTASAAAVVIMGGGAALAILTLSGPQDAAPESSRTTSPHLFPPGYGSRTFACGQAVSFVTSEGQYHLTITRSYRTAAGVPGIDADLATTGTNTRNLPLPQGPGGFRLLILRHGMIVAGQDPLPAPRFNPKAYDPMLAPLATVGPSRPYHFSLGLTDMKPCPGVQWSELWGSPDTNLVAITDINPVFRDGNGANAPLIGAAVPAARTTATVPHVPQGFQGPPTSGRRK
jgi:hypothetical protein